MKHKVVPKLMYSEHVLAVGRGGGNRMLLTRTLQKSSGRGLVSTGRNRLWYSPPEKGQAQGWSSVSQQPFPSEC